jgi:ABC-type uncharacterized transport system permease subunit
MRACGHGSCFPIAEYEELREEAMLTLPRRFLPALQLLSMIFVALCLVPAGAHLFALPNKLALSDEDYLLVQGIYRGWWMFAFAVLPAIALTWLHAWAVRTERARFVPALSAALCMLASQAIFWIWTYPASHQTESWTRLTENFATLRTQWEYSHAAAACVVMAAFVCLVWSILERSDTNRSRQTRPTLVQGRTVYRAVRTIRR